MSEDRVQDMPDITMAAASLLHRLLLSEDRHRRLNSFFAHNRDQSPLPPLWQGGNSLSFTRTHTHTQGIHPNPSSRPNRFQPRPAHP